MPQHREGEFLGRHADAVVGDLDAVDPAAIQRHDDPRAAGIERVLHQFLHRGGRPLDHLTGGNAVDRGFGEQANAGDRAGDSGVGVGHGRV